jgi:hypothetical protein
VRGAQAYLALLAMYAATISVITHPRDPCRAHLGMCSPGRIGWRLVASCLGLAVAGCLQSLLILTPRTLAVSLVFRLVSSISWIPYSVSHGPHPVLADSFLAGAFHSRCCRAWASIFLPCPYLCCPVGRGLRGRVWGSWRSDARSPLRRCCGVWSVVKRYLPG